MNGPSYISPGTPISTPRKKKQIKRSTWAEKQPVHSINVPPTVPTGQRSKWIRNAVTDLARQLSSQCKLADKRVSRRDFSLLVAGATDRELTQALSSLTSERVIRVASLEGFLMADPSDNKTFCNPQPVKPKGRNIQRVFYRGELVTCYWLSKLPENVHRLTHQDLRKRIIVNNWTAEMALAMARKVELSDSSDVTE